MDRWTADRIADQSGRVAVVTGANSGIGYPTALELARHGATVVVASRSRERGEDAVRRLEAEGASGEAVFIALDLASQASVRRFAERFLARFDRLDLLVNNAGVMATPEARTEDGFELQLGTNHLGHFALTGRLLERLVATPGSRVVTVSSMAHRQGRMDFADLHSETKDYDRWQSYGQSKLANLLFTFELQRRLEAAGAPTLAVAAHPGWTATNLQKSARIFRWLNPLLAMKPEQGALPTLYAAVAPGVSGGDYIGPDGWMEARGYPTRVDTTESARSLEDAARLWQVSIESVEVDYAALAPESVELPLPSREGSARPAPAMG